jgi:hypothetical protein
METQTTSVKNEKSKENPYSLESLNILGYAFGFASLAFIAYNIFQIVFY